ncbi:MAG: manganese efflux pump [Oscillospiraceae bacterium]
MSEEIMLVTAVCMDMFFAAFSYGKNRIRIPFASMLIISLTGATVLIFAIEFSEVISRIIPDKVCIYGGAAILVLIGSIYLFRDFFKAYLQKMDTDSRQLKILIDECNADIDNSKELSVKEAFLLSVSLSADSLASGTGAGFIGINPLRTWIIAAAGGIIMMGSGLLAGKYMDMKFRGNFSWIGGIILILLGIRRLL